MRIVTNWSHLGHGRTLDRSALPSTPSIPRHLRHLATLATPTTFDSPMIYSIISSAPLPPGSRGEFWEFGGAPPIESLFVSGPLKGCPGLQPRPRLWLPAFQPGAAAEISTLAKIRGGATPTTMGHGPHAFPWVPMGSHGSPWVPHGSPMGPHGHPMGAPWVLMGAPWVPNGSPQLCYRRSVMLITSN